MCHALRTLLTIAAHQGPTPWKEVLTLLAASA
jgi:hypothetical protein